MPRAIQYALRGAIRRTGALAASHLAKIAGGDVLTARGFDRAVLSIFNSVRALLGPADALTIARLIRAVEDAARVDEALAQSAVDEIARSVFGLRQEYGPRLVGLLRTEAETIAAQAKRANARKYKFNIDASLSQGDARVADAVANSTAHFIRDSAGKRLISASAQARDIVSRGVADGFDRRAISKMLRAELSEEAQKRSDAYYRMVADVYAQRARSYGALRSFEEARVEVYEWNAIIDEPTCNVCRFMDGRRFYVAPALRAFTETAEARDPEDVQFSQPWLSERRDPETGRSTIGFTSRSGERVVVADIIESAAGVVDARGKYSARVSEREMQGLGIGAPPIHGHCRCAIIAVV
jgi:SPP1 gp7 family putative phage head morphogenesis protein